MPGKVRERLGTEKDLFYEWLSEVSHPRFAGFQMTFYRVVGAEEGDAEDPVPVLHGYIGGLPLEMPPVLIASTMPSNVLCLLGLQLGHCPVKREVAWTWATVARSIPETLRPGYEAIYGVLEEMGGEQEMTKQILAHVDYVIEQGREMEEIVRTDREQQEAN